MLPRDAGSNPALYFALSSLLFIVELAKRDIDKMRRDRISINLNISIVSI